MARKTDCTPEALLGYRAPAAKSPYLATSSADAAFRIGQWLARTSRSLPRNVSPSRGDTYHVNGMKVSVRYDKGASTIERVA